MKVDESEKLRRVDNHSQLVWLMTCRHVWNNPPPPPPRHPTTTTTQNKTMWKTVTWDQALFSFRFEITFRRPRRNEKRAWYKPSTKRLPPTFLIDWHLPNQPTKITSVACFSSMQIFHAWEKCRLADLKSSFYLLIFSAKNKTVNTITFNFLRD